MTDEKLSRFRVHYLWRASELDDWRNETTDVVCRGPEIAKGHVRKVTRPNAQLIFGKVKLVREERRGTR